MQILIGSDKVALFPKNVVDENGHPVQTQTARLLKSSIMQKYLAHGFHAPNIQVNVNSQSGNVITRAVRPTAAPAPSVTTDPDSIEVRYR